jgi:GT2 family glycosyltransferase
MRKSIERIACSASGNRNFAGTLSRDLRAGWHLVVIRAPQKRPKWLAVLRMTPAEDLLPPVEIVLVQPYRFNPFGIKFGVFYLPRPQQQLSVDIYSKQDPPAQVEVILARVFRPVASVMVCLQNMSGFAAALRLADGSALARLRKALAITSIGGQNLPQSYSNWLSWFDDWPAERIDALRASPNAARRPAVSALVFQAGEDAGPLNATLESLRRQIMPVTGIEIRRPGGAPAGEAAGGKAAGGYVAVLQAGEIIPPHAILLLAEEAARLDFPDMMFADEDRLDGEGKRSQPLFKPQPNLTYMCSGLLSRGVWLVRREWLGGADWAECARLQAWFMSYEADRASATRRIPYLLTHRAANAENAPPEALAAVVGGFLARAGFGAIVKPGFPLRIQWQPGALRTSKISLIVPSRLRGETQLACLREVLEKTIYPNFEMLVLVTQAAPFDAGQLQAIAQLSRHANFRAERVDSATFNYSAANNIGAAKTNGAFICLLNDDVAPIGGDWLDRMVGFFADPGCAIVGPKLFYPNLTTQHGGVIMGLAGLVEHANRFLPRGKPGYAWRAELDQELSAVTGACLLVRREVYEQVGGLDEDFPTAFNDIDFCLRVRERGHGIVFAASVEMIHHETITFGQHYSPETSEQEDSDIRRLRARWSQICRADPFHNPNLSLIGRSEWNLAYPPRQQPQAVA